MEASLAKKPFFPVSATALPNQCFFAGKTTIKTCALIKTRRRTFCGEI